MLSVYKPMTDAARTARNSSSVLSEIKTMVTSGKALEETDWAKQLSQKLRAQLESAGQGETWLAYERDSYADRVRGAFHSFELAVLNYRTIMLRIGIWNQSDDSTISTVDDLEQATNALWKTAQSLEEAIGAHIDVLENPVLGRLRQRGKARRGRLQDGRGQTTEA